MFLQQLKKYQKYIAKIFLYASDENYKLIFQIKINNDFIYILA